MNTIGTIFGDLADAPCRACMIKCPNTKMIDLFNEDQIGNIFTEFTSLQVMELDGLPSHLCQVCYQICTNFREFKTKCIRSDHVFRQEIAIKQEQDEVLNKLKSEPINLLENVGNRKSKDVFVKTEPECNIETFHDYEDFSAWNDQSDESNKHSLKKNKKKISPTKKKNESDSDWNNSGENFNAHFSDDKKPKKKRIKKKPTKTSTKNDTSKLEKFFCDHCDKVFHKKHRIQAHLRTHLGLKPFACDECNVSFRKWASIVLHNKMKHGAKEDFKMFVCPHTDCGREYSLKQTLKVHLRTFHLGEPHRKGERIICELCGKSFPTHFAAKEHNYTHTGEKPFACTQCPKQFISNYKLKIHLMRHNDIRNHVCSVCGLRKTTMKELKVHMNYHTKEKTFACDQCPAVFNSYQNINRHERIVHRGYKPYICTYCQRSFSKAETLKHHTMIHTGEKPHACTLCDKRFIQIVALRAHMKTHEKAKMGSRNALNVNI